MVNLVVNFKTKALRQVAAILLLLIFSFSFTGSFVVLKFQQYELRKEIVLKIKSGIPKEQLSTIAISSKDTTDLIWKDSEEFSYRGMMYDIVYVEKTVDVTIYHCLTDTQETKLIAEFNKEKKKNSKNSTNPSVKIAKLLSRINPLPQKENLFSFSEKQKTKFTYFNHYTSPKLDISSPPPKSSLVHI